MRTNPGDIFQPRNQEPTTQPQGTKFAPHGINDERNAGDEAIRIQISTTSPEHATHRCLTSEFTGLRGFSRRSGGTKG